MFIDFLSPSENGSLSFVGGRTRKILEGLLAYEVPGSPVAVATATGRLRERSIKTVNHKSSNVSTDHPAASWLNIKQLTEPQRKAGELISTRKI